MIQPHLQKKVDLAIFKSDVDKLDINELKTVPDNLYELESQVNKIGVDKLKTVPVGLTKLSGAVGNDVVKNNCRMN